MNLYKLHNGDLINLDHLCQIHKSQGYRGSTDCKVMGTFVGGTTVELATFPDERQAQDAINLLYQGETWTESLSHPTTQ